MNKTKFYRYVLSFYGFWGLYPMKATRKQVVESTKILIERFGKENVCGDAVDRERVRDIMIEKFGLVFPK